MAQHLFRPDKSRKFPGVAVLKTAFLIRRISVILIVSDDLNASNQEILGLNSWTICLIRFKRRRSSMASDQMTWR
ncbi:hypothetical protein [Methanospirillum lacunae]|uniref:Uncharacterized protein n=1 Tax=Methanospirillum lacunae TaxID=668570 RepID=A0A2V2MVE8_9EURY|nr:hypothetical protein [Methanospirillum lacunae]PWR70270.1 hypothetical protein DK846_15250 [Methanospirillum lacunae]